MKRSKLLIPGLSVVFVVSISGVLYQQSEQRSGLERLFGEVSNTRQSLVAIEEGVHALSEAVADLDLRLRTIEELVSDTALAVEGLRQSQDEVPSTGAGALPDDTTQEARLPEEVFTFTGLPERMRAEWEARWAETPGCMKPILWYHVGSRGYYSATLTRGTDDPGAHEVAADYLVAVSDLMDAKHWFKMRQILAGNFETFPTSEEARDFARSYGDGNASVSPADDQQSWRVVDLRPFRQSDFHARQSALVDSLGHELNAVYGTGIMTGGPEIF